MLKLAGILLLMAGCTGMGINKVAEEKGRIRELREIRAMIVRMQSEIIYGKRTLPEICLLFSGYAKEPYQSAFATLYQRMEENDGKALYVLWEEEMGHCMENLPLKEDEKEILINLPKKSGMPEETMQAADVGQSLDIITERIAGAQAEYENKAKVIMSISIMAGLFLIILFL
ncbi:MAG: stage III sporulation protein AB [Ruminococcus sp.]|nr:stage III sporulation protein AB [Ruminococcus sp.]